MNHEPMPRPATSPVFGQLYAACAVLGFVSTFMPLWSPHDEGDSNFLYMSLWNAMSTGGDGAAVGGRVLMFALVGCLLAAARPALRSPGLPIVIIMLCVAALALLITKPQSSDPKPYLGAGGGLMLGLTIFLIITCVVHTFVLSTRRPSVPPSA